MEQHHKEILRKNYVKLQEIFCDHVEDICDCLIEAGVLSRHFTDPILKGSTVPLSQASALLDTIKRRGPTAFDHLYNATVWLSLHTAADILKPENKPHDKSKKIISEDPLVFRHDESFENQILAESWSPEHYIELVQSTNIPVDTLEDKAWYTEMVNKEACYPLKKRGKPYIVTDTKMLTGDRKAIGILLEKLGFETVMVIKSHDLKTQIEKNNSNCDILVLFVYTTERSQLMLEIERILFDCLRGKPKLVFHFFRNLSAAEPMPSNAGDAEQEKNNVSNLVKLTKNLNLEKTSSITTNLHPGSETQLDTGLAGPSDRPVDTANLGAEDPRNAHIFKIISMDEGNEVVTCGDVEYTKFIQLIVFIFSKAAKRYPLYNLITLVNRKARANVAMIQKSVGKHVFFLPGYP